VTIKRRIGVMFAALGLVALSVSPALGATLNPGSGGPGTGAECESTGVTVPDGYTLWRFTLINQVTTPQDSGPTLSVTWDTGSGQTVKTYQPLFSTDHTIYHYNAIELSSWTLVTASTDESPAGSNVNTLNLSFYCAGGPPPEVPEAPMALLLPIISMFAFGSYVLKNRRQSTQGI
jgi:hypothetical protein